MNASELSRQLLFYGYDEVTDYLKNSPLNRYIYKKFLTILPEYGITVPLVTMFNEIYYQCVRVNYDGMPGVDVEKRYIAEEEERLQSQTATNIVFGLTWAILRSKRKLTFHEECFLSQLTPYIENCGIREIIKTFHTEIRYLDIEIPDSFPTMTCPVEDIPKFVVVERNYRHRSLTDMINASVESRLGLDNQFFEYNEHTEAWMAVTSNYSHSVIENYVRLYSRPEDQLELIDRIQRTLPTDEIVKQDNYFRDLISKIKTGNFDLEDDFTGQRVAKDYHEADENDDFRYNLALYKVSCEEEIDVVGNLKKERDSLKSQIADLKKSHAMEMAKKEAMYKAEIDKIRKERNKLAHEPVVVKTPIKEAKPKELTLTLSEVATFVMERFSRAGANEVCTMLYGKASEHGFLGEDTFKVIDGIVPGVIEREKPHQTIEIPQAGQVNINPQQVINQTKEEDKQ